jgi:hypothetical protein
MSKTYITLALVVFALLAAPFYGITQEASLGQYLRTATGSVYVQYARYADKDRTKPVETKWVFLGPLGPISRLKNPRFGLPTRMYLVTHPTALTPVVDGGSQLVNTV